VRRPRSLQSFGTGGAVRRVRRVRLSVEVLRGEERCTSSGARMGGMLP
jgi:hypothetical protein